MSKSRFTLEIPRRDENTIPDLTIRVKKASNENGVCYQFIVDSAIPEISSYLSGLTERIFHTEDFNRNPEDRFNEICSEINETYIRYIRLSRTDGSISASGSFFTEINNIGTELYDRLFPPELKELYWLYIRDKVESILIISDDEFWIPWELIRPYKDWTEDEFLCEKFILTRWLLFPDSKTATPSLLPVCLDRLKVIAAEISSHAQLEKDEIKKILGDRVEIIVPELDKIKDLFHRDNFSSLHFACHGEYDRENPNKSKLYLSKKHRLSPVDIKGKFDPERPFVFLNACDSGREGTTITGTGGWAKIFLQKANVIGFIGSNWKIDSESAKTFAIAFYNNLLNGGTIGEAGRQARISVRRDGDPTWLSYVIYSHPYARLMS